MTNQYPGLYHVGLMKTGTTTLQEVLASDKRINLILKSGYFNTNRFYTDDYSYSSISQINIESDETISREGKYVGLEESLRRIKSIRPDAKIIVTLREQRSLLISAYKHHIRQTNDAYSFEAFLNSAEGQNYIKHLNFNSLYELINFFFPKEQIEFFLFEDLKSDFSSFLKVFYQNVFKISKPETSQKLLENKGLNDNQVLIKKNLNKIRLFNEKNILKKLDDLISKLVLKIFTPFTSSENKYIVWENTLIFKKLELEFRKSNSDFKKKTGIDLAQKGYLV